MGNSASMSPWASTFEFIKQTHDEAFRSIEAAITLEEQEKPNEAIEKYKDGILLIDKALGVQITCPENPDFTWERARLMIQKMKKARAEVIMRINSITTSSGFVPHEPPPSYDEATSSSGSTDIPRTYTELAVALNDLPIEATDNLYAEIIYSHPEVRLYFISPDGTVTQTSKPQTLNIGIIPGSDHTATTIFLQIGNWIYPLVPGVSPCYRTDYGAFILPDVHSDIAGSSVGIILPSDADASVYELLENILHGVISQQTALEPRDRSRRHIEHPAPEGISGAISNGLVTGAFYVSRGLIQGAQKAGSLISYGTPKIINNITPAAEATPLSPTLTKGLEVASKATGTAAQVTGYVAEKVGVATQALGRFLAPHIQRQGTRLLTSGFNMSEEEASSKVEGVLTVAAGAVEGFSTIYRGLETSASILGHNLSNNTVKIVEHKYGGPAGQLASDTFNTVGNVITIGHNSRFLTPKGLVKNAAKQTGKAMVEERTRQGFQHQANGASTSTSFVYPNLLPIQLESLTSVPTTGSSSESSSIHQQQSSNKLPSKEEEKLT